MIKKLFYLLLVVIVPFLLASCRGDYLVVKHIKPKNYNRPYNPKKDKYKKRTKKVKRLIIRQREYASKH